VNAPGQVFGGVEFALHECPIDDQFRCIVQKACSLPRLDLLPHRLEVPLHAVYPNREDVYKAKVLGVLGEHGREHARDDVAKPELQSPESLELEGWIRRVEALRRNDRYKWLIQRQAKRHKKIPR
jgi:hypothetical protein